MQQSQSNIITVQNLSKLIYKAKGWFKKETEVILHPISFSVLSNEFVLIVGRNGSGKSTLLKCISGIVYPDQGSVQVLGKNPFEHRVHLARQMGILFGQKSLLFTDLQGLDYLQLLRKVYGLTEAAFQQALEEVDSLLTCKHLLGKRVRGMSYGEKMKLEILSVVLHQPAVLILDEPFVGLDQPAQKQLLDFLTFYKHKYNCTILLTTHQSLEVLQIADRILVLDQGQLKFDGMLGDVIKQYSNRKVIRIAWAKPIQPFHQYDLSPFMQIVMQDAYTSVLEVDTDQIQVSKLLIELLEHGEIKDFEVSSISMDKVVEKLYE